MHVYCSVNDELLKIFLKTSKVYRIFMERCSKNSNNLSCLMCHFSCVKFPLEDARFFANSMVVIFLLLMLPYLCQLKYSATYISVIPSVNDTVLLRINLLISVWCLSCARRDRAEFNYDTLVTFCADLAPIQTMQYVYSENS